MTELPLPEFHPIVSKVWQTDVKGEWEIEAGEHGAAISH